MRKSGKLSCCGHGGSWFGSCGSIRNVNVGHIWTWYEGIRACKRRKFQLVVDHQPGAEQAEGNAFSDADSVGMDPNAVPVNIRTFAFTSADTWARMPVVSQLNFSSNLPIITSARASIRYDGSGARSSKVIATTGTAIFHNSANMSTTNSTTSPTNRTIIPAAPPKIIPAVNLAIIKSMRSNSADMHVTTASHISASGSIIARQYEKSVCVSIVLVSVCWY